MGLTLLVFATDSSGRPAARRSSWPRMLLAPAFGGGMALAFAVGWVALDRAVSARTLTAMLFIATAGMLAACVALIVARLAASRPWSARFAAAFFLLTAGTGGLASLFMAVQTAWMSHDLTAVPLHIALLIVGFVGMGAIYGFLAIAALLMLPLGLPLIVLAAAAIARGAR